MALRPGCLTCKRTDWFEYGHWLICRHCEKDFILAVMAGQPPRFKPELFNVGVPNRNGGP